MADEPSEIKDVYLRERSRGRKHPIDVEARRLRNRLLQDMRWLLEYGTEEEMRVAMRALGLQEDSPQWENALEVWRELRGQ
jgi:hypothetical protein